MSEAHESQPFGRNTCHICGGTDFMWGVVTDIQPNGMYFFETSTPLETPFWMKNSKIEPRRLNARRCVMCSNVQFFTVDEDKTK